MGDQFKCGVSVILNLTSRIHITKSADYIDNLYFKWYNIKRGDKESLEDYTANSIKLQSDLEYTSKPIPTGKLVRKLRQGFRVDLAPINTALGDLRAHTLPIL